MLIVNCQIVFIDRIEMGAVEIEGGSIKKIYLKEDMEQIRREAILHSGQEFIDAEGLFLAPGFIDIHIHGAGGHDTMEGTSEALISIASAIVVHGTTAFVPTTMTVEKLEIRKALKNIRSFMRKETGGAQVLGAHLEGPFVSPEAVGAQNPKHLLVPSVKAYENIVQDNEEAIISMTIAPEQEGAEALIKYVTRRGINCAVGHSKATYEEMTKARVWGVTHATHLYNAMTPFNHREPGIVGAVFDSDMTAELICDGIHNAYPAIRIACKQKSTDQIILVSDAMMACCKPAGQYELGGQVVYVNENAARLKNGALAGSVLTLDRAIYNVCEHCPLPLYEVVKMATYNPARFCKVDNKKGLIKEGYDADLVLFNEKIEVKRVWIKGKEVVNK